MKQTKEIGAVMKVVGEESSSELDKYKGYKNRIIAVKNLIIKEDWPVRWLAEQIGVSIPTIYRWKNSKGASVNESHLMMLAGLKKCGVKFTPDRKQCKFVPFEEEIPSESELRSDLLDLINNRKRRNKEWTNNKRNFVPGRRNKMSPNKLFYEQEELLKKIYKLKMDDYRFIKQLINRFYAEGDK